VSGFLLWNFHIFLEFLQFDVAIGTNWEVGSGGILP
jgi:hypothetical protein